MLQNAKRLQQNNRASAVESWTTCKQIHYREVPRWEIFMEQELRFGPDLGRLALLKKKHLGRL